MKKQRREFEINLIVSICTVIFVIALADNCGSAEDPEKFPSRPITLIVPYTAGGAVDLSARKIADIAGGILGQRVVVENKTGGGGVIGATAVAKAPADGYTLGAAAVGALIVNPILRSVLYKTKEDFTYLMEYAAMTFIFTVLPDSRWKSMREFIEEARRNPGKLSYAASGPGGTNHLFLEQIFSIAKVKLKYVPTAGGAETTIQMLGGHVDGALAAEMAPHVQSGKLRGLAVQGENRLAGFQEIPTFLEMGYKVESHDWICLFGPKGLDPGVLKKLYEAFKKAHEDQSYRDFCGSIYVIPSFRDSESFKRMIFREADEQRIILKEIGLIK